MLLRVSHLQKSYSGPTGGKSRPVLKDVSFELPERASLAITGPSGSGKSTLLHLLGLLDRPDGGEILFKGKLLAGLSGREQDLFRNREIGFVFQLHYLLPQHSVLQNVLLPAAAGARRIPSAAVERARTLLERVGLKDLLHARPGELSGGERQRAALVRALINRPSLLLADEPTGSLDRTTARAAAGLLGELNREEGTALIVVTHAEEIAADLDSVRRLQDGLLLDGRLT